MSIVNIARIESMMKLACAWKAFRKFALMPICANSEYALQRPVTKRNSSLSVTCIGSGTGRSQPPLFRVVGVVLTTVILLTGVCVSSQAVALLLLDSFFPSDYRIGGSCGTRTFSRLDENGRGVFEQRCTYGDHVDFTQALGGLVFGEAVGIYERFTETQLIEQNGEAVSNAPISTNLAFAFINASSLDFYGLVATSRQADLDILPVAVTSLANNGWRAFSNRTVCSDVGCGMNGPVFAPVLSNGTLSTLAFTPFALENEWMHVYYANNFDHPNFRPIPANTLLSPSTFSVRGGSPATAGMLIDQNGDIVAAAFASQSGPASQGGGVGSESPNTTSEPPTMAVLLIGHRFFKKIDSVNLSGSDKK